MRTRTVSWSDIHIHDGPKLAGHFESSKVFYSHVGVAPCSEEPVSDGFKDEICSCCICDSFARPRTARIDLQKYNCNLTQKNKIRKQEITVKLDG